jgi:hypothetical protein
LTNWWARRKIVSATTLCGVCRRNVEVSGWGAVREEEEIIAVYFHKGAFAGISGVMSIKA